MRSCSRLKLRRRTGPPSPESSSCPSSSFSWPRFVSGFSLQARPVACCPRPAPLSSLDPSGPCRPSGPRGPPASRCPSSAPPPSCLREAFVSRDRLLRSPVAASSRSPVLFPFPLCPAAPSGSVVRPAHIFNPCHPCNLGVGPARPLFPKWLRSYNSPALPFLASFVLPHFAVSRVHSYSTSDPAKGVRSAQEKLLTPCSEVRTCTPGGSARPAPPGFSWVRSYSRCPASIRVIREICGSFLRPMASFVPSHVPSSRVRSYDTSDPAQGVRSSKAKLLTPFPDSDASLRAALVLLCDYFEASWLRVETSSIASGRTSSTIARTNASGSSNGTLCAEPSNQMRRLAGASIRLK